MNNNHKHLLADLSRKEKRALLKKLLQKENRDRFKQLMSQVEVINVADLKAEAVLESEISPETVPVETVTEPAHVFLTGATGFLGAFLLAELLRRTEAAVYCLVRSPNAGKGKERIKETLEFYSLWNEDLTSRIVPVAGDLSEPLFGLSSERFRELAGEIDTIYHSAASVNWVYPYSSLKPTNVLGTREVLRLATRIAAKPVHFVSTLAVFPLVGNSEAGVVREQDPLDHGGVLYNGYSQSKWVAEKLVMAARSRGLPVCIYRPALITGSSETGAWNTDDVTCKMMRNWIERGTVPDMDTTMSMVPVDYISRAIVYLSGQNESFGKCFHLANPRPAELREVAGWIHSFGYPLRRVPYNEWRAELIDPAKRLQEHDLYSLAPLLSMNASADAPSIVRAIPEFDCRNTLGGLAGSSIVCPPVDSRVFETYLSFLVRIGFLEQPVAA